MREAHPRVGLRLARVRNDRLRAARPEGPHLVASRQSPLFTKGKTKRRFPSASVARRPATSLSQRASTSVLIATGRLLNPPDAATVDAGRDLTSRDPSSKTVAVNASSSQASALLLEA